MPSRRKFLMILIDQFRADCLNGALADHIDLPHIRALAGDGVQFNSHFSVTNPCGPSRASILTGQYAMNHRSVRNGTPLADDTPNIAREMRKAGYEPLLYGYTDTSRDPRGKAADDPVLRTYEEVLPGFTEIVEMRIEYGSFPWQADLKAKGYDLPDYHAFYVPKSPDPTRAPRADDPAFYKAEDSDTAFLTNAFLSDMAGRVDQSWFALLTYIRPHPPLVAPAPYNKMYQGRNLPLPHRHSDPMAEQASHPFLTTKKNRPPMESFVDGCDGEISSARDQDVQMLRAIYLGLATEVDTHIGRVIQFLKDSGQYDDTVILLAADHGEMLGDHHFWGKTHIYDPAFRVPLIIRDPLNHAANGVVVSELTESIDLAPTILDLANHPTPNAMNGRSLVPFLGGDTPANWRDCVHLELDFGEPDTPTAMQTLLGLELHDCNLAILREEQFKLVHFGGGLAPLLFDLHADPYEMQDLAQDPAHAASMLRLTQKLLSHRMRNANHTLSDLKITDAGVFGRVP